MEEQKCFSDTDIQEFKQVYELFDYDENGTISTDELGTVMRALGRHPSDADLERIINETDAEGNGVIEFPEFLAIMSKTVNEMDSEEDLREAINVIFKERDAISAIEVWYLLRKFGDKLSDEEVNEMIQQAKTDPDGKIKYEDFLRVMGVTPKAI